MGTEAKTSRLPFFVYGTLLPGQPNYHLWETHITSQTAATLTNGRLYDVGAYPMLVESPAEIVQGMVMTIPDDVYEQVVAQLDHLEGYIVNQPQSSDYVRAAREVLLADGRRVKAWVYIGQVHFVQNLPIVENGNWLAHLEHKQQNPDWWQNTTTVKGRHRHTRHKDH